MKVDTEYEDPLLTKNYEEDSSDSDIENVEENDLKKKQNIKVDKNDLTIYPIKLDESKLNQGEAKYPLSSPVHLHIVVGRVKAGKSLLINNLYLSPRFFGDEYKTKILISTTAYNDAVNKYMLEDFDFIFSEYSDELMDELIDMVENDQGDGRFLIVFDDIIGNVNFKRVGADKISSLISRYRHIGNQEQEGKLALCFTSQYWKYFNNISRTNGTAYYILGSFPEAELKKMAEDLSFFGGSQKEFIELFNKSRQNPYDFLYLSVEHLEARRNHDEILWKKDTKLDKKPVEKIVDKNDEEDEATEKKNNN